MPQPPFRKILFLNPPTGLYRRDDRCQCTVEDQTVQIVFPPMELAMAAACAERAGALCRIEDYPAARRGWEDYIADIKEFAPDLLVVSSTTATLKGDLETCRLAKELVPGVVTAGKGETLVHNAVDVLTDAPELDLVLPNESEDAVEELASGRMITEVAGLHFRPTLLEEFGLEPAPNCTRPVRKSQVSRIAAKREERESAMAVVEAPPEAPTTRSESPGAIRSLSTRARQAVQPAQGSAAASVGGRRGWASSVAAGWMANSASPPCGESMSPW